MSGSAERTLHATTAAIPAPDAAAARAAAAALAAKAKPRGSLGRLEGIACRVAGIRRTPDLMPLPATIVVAAADHGVAAEGVSAYPSEVTSQMLATFAEGGAAINVLARRAGADVMVLDAGVASPLEKPGVRALRIGPGTGNFSVEPAMTRDQALDAIAGGIRVAAELASAGVGIVGLGEMGIGNSTAAAAITAALLGVDARAVCGRGAGLDEAGLRRKVEVVQASLRRHNLRGRDPLATLSAVGGFEVGVLAGIALGAAARRIVVLLDGYISTAAALIAARLAPRAAEAMIAAHRSPEPGHSLALESLRLDPLLSLDLRLGEGTGAAIALPLVQASLAIVHEMATFESAAVTDARR